MFVGHLAVALAAKKAHPGVPLGASVAAAFGLDLLWPILLLLGLETVRVNPGDTAFTSLAFDAYPWSHSLLAVLVWSGAVGVLGRRLFDSWRAGILLGGLVLSHWVLDAVTHRPDLPLWPGGPLIGLGLWGWRSSEGWPRFVLAALIPLTAATLWGTFAVPGDPSRSGGAPIAVPGSLRLAIEAAIFAFGVWALTNTGFTRASLVFGILVVVHYAASYDRIAWLLNR